MLWHGSGGGAEGREGTVGATVGATGGQVEGPWSEAADY
jgi:hypothetical protein